MWNFEVQIYRALTWLMVPQTHTNIFWATIYGKNSRQGPFIVINLPTGRASRPQSFYYIYIFTGYVKHIPKKCFSDRVSFIWVMYSQKGTTYFPSIVHKIWYKLEKNINVVRSWLLLSSRHKHIGITILQWVWRCTLHLYYRIINVGYFYLGFLVGVIIKDHDYGKY